jgi:Rho-binding antiterminator
MIPSVIACDIHDHIEIICMRRYPVILHLLDSAQVPGVARDIRSAAQQEYLLLDQKGVNIEVPLLQIERLEVLAANAPQQQIWLAQAGSCSI